MPLPGVLFLISFGVLIVSPFILMFTKAYYHFHYIKKIYPDELKHYNDFSDIMKFVVDTKIVWYNKYVTLLLPFFRRFPEQEKAAEILKLGRKVKLFCKLIYYDIAFIAITVALLIIFFGD